MNAIEVARPWVGQRETDGPNRSPLIDSLCREFGVPLGSSWCALFVSHSFRQAGALDFFPYSASSQEICAWFQDHERLSRDPDDLLKWKGALGGWTDPDSAHGHIFLIAGRLVNRAQHVAEIATIEGNTSSDGSRNGDGCYARRRRTTEGLWYLNTTGIPGGEWWP